MQRFRLRVDDVEAMQFNGKNFDEVADWIAANNPCSTGVSKQTGRRNIHLKIDNNIAQKKELIVKPGQWIVRTPNFMYFAYRQQDFKNIYMPAEEKA